MSEKRFGFTTGGRYPRPESSFRKVRDLDGEVGKKKDGIVLLRGDKKRKGELKDVLELLDEEAREFFRELVKSRNIIALKKVIDNIAKAFPDKADYFETIKKELFENMNGIDWERIESSLGIS